MPRLVSVVNWTRLLLTCGAKKNITRQAICGRSGKKLMNLCRSLKATKNKVIPLTNARPRETSTAPKTAIIKAK